MRNRLVKEEEGFTLVEMMVTISIMIIVLFALYNIFDMSIRVFSFGNNKVEAVENARIGLEKVSREVRAAYPYDKGASTPDEHLFATPLSATQITFANDSGSGNHVIDPATEQISYSLSASGPPYTLQRRVGTGSEQPVVEYIGVFDNGTPANTSDDTPGLKLEYLKRSGTNLVATSVESEIEVIRVTLVIEKGSGDRKVKQQISTDADLRSRS